MGEQRDVQRSPRLHPSPFVLVVQRCSGLIDAEISFAVCDRLLIARE